MWAAANSTKALAGRTDWRTSLQRARATADKIAAHGDATIAQFGDRQASPGIVVRMHDRRADADRSCCDAQTAPDRFMPVQKDKASDIDMFSAPHICHFASCTIDTAKRELRNDDAVVAVEPKVFDLLVYLIDNSERVVTKDELVEQIWQGRAISDSALSSCVKAARRVIGDDGQRQSLIRTIHGRGFRFVGDLSHDAGGQAMPSCSRPAADEASAIAPCADMQCVEQDCYTVDLDLSLPKQPSIAVLPLKELNAAPDNLCLAEGLTHDLTVRLARTRWLFVAARASVSKLHANALESVDIGRRLGVRYLLHGTIIQADRRFRLSISLCDVIEACEVWAEQFDRTIDDLFAVQDEIGDLVIAAVESEIEQQERRRAELTPLASLDAWSAYHRACNHLYRFTPQDADQAERHLHLAAQLDPNSPRVFAALSFVHWQRAFLENATDRQGAIGQALDYGRHSVSLDALDPLGHWALGRANILEGAFSEGVAELQAAVSLNPNFAVGQYSLAFGMTFTGQQACGIAAVAHARRLSPYDPMTYAFMSQLAVIHAMEGDGAVAAQWAARAVRQPNAHYHIFAIAAWCHMLAGRKHEARSYLGELLRRRPGYSMKEYFRAFPYPAVCRADVARHLTEAGLQGRP